MNHCTRLVRSALAGVALALVTLPACTPREHAAPGSRLVFTPHALADSIGDCPGGRGCARVTLRWVEASGGPAADSLNAWIRARAWAGTGERGDRTESAPESVTTRFIAENRAFRHDFPDAASAGWVLERVTTVLLDTLGVVTLGATEESYTGGAHGNHVARHASFSAADGRRWGLADMIAPGHDAEFLALAERGFRATRSIPARVSLAEAGFFEAEGGRFRLSDDVAVVRDGLQFHWDPYEIGPYAAGATTVTLPWTEVARFIRRDGPLAPFVR